MTQPTTLYLLIEERLRVPLSHFVATRRPAMAWRRIAMEIWQRTGVDVTYEALRQWFPDADANTVPPGTPPPSPPPGPRGPGGPTGPPGPSTPPNPPPGRAAEPAGEKGRAA